jgi:hypothetical protein
MRGGNKTGARKDLVGISPALGRGRCAWSGANVLVYESELVLLQPLSMGRCAMSLPCLLDMAAPPQSRIGTLAHRGPVGHLAGTGARTVRRVRRNDLGVLPIFRNTRPIRTLPLSADPLQQEAHHPRDSARKKWFDLGMHRIATCLNGSVFLTELLAPQPSGMSRGARASPRPRTAGRT